MPDRTKIATCCYCGRREVLRLTARGGHELACGSCGAPLHEMKWLKPPDPVRPVKPSPPLHPPHGRRDAPRSRRKVRRRKPTWARALKQVFEIIEDVFD